MPYGKRPMSGRAWPVATAPGIVGAVTVAGGPEPESGSDHAGGNHRGWPSLTQAAANVPQVRWIPPGADPNNTLPLLTHPTAVNLTQYPLWGVVLVGPPWGS